MAQPITSLVASWAPIAGITLSWTAASDATSGSVYNIYVLQDVKSIAPTWFPVTQCGPVLVTSSAVSGPVLSPPVTTFIFSASAIAALMAPPSTVAPYSLAFSIIHVDYTGTESIATNISVFQQAVNPIYGAPHLANTLTFDAFGQAAVNPQDSYEEIAGSVSVFMGTDLGQRPMAPDYGVLDLPFDQIDIGLIESSLNEWEPRAQAMISVVYNDENQATMSVQIQGVAA